MKTRIRTTREHMAIQIRHLRARPHIILSGVDMLERARFRSSYDRRRAIRNVGAGTGWLIKWDCRKGRVPELLSAVKRVAMAVKRHKTGKPIRKTP